MLNNTPIVILLHGLGRDRHIMDPMEKALIAAGFDTHNMSYPSRKYAIETLAHQIADRINEKFSDRVCYFVTHSLGSLILRYIAAHQLVAHIDRVVMLGPPNHGTAIIDLMRRSAWFRHYWGPAALELATDGKGIYHSLPEPIDFDCGIIAGNRTLDPWFSWTILKGPDDGKVTVVSTKLKGMKDHIVIPGSHLYLPRNKSVIRQTICFLKENRFEHS